jgi:hypothetical protein
VVDALNMRNGPKITVIYNLPLNLPVWSSLYNLLSIKNKTYTIQLLYRPTNFRSTVVKPYLVDRKITEDTQPEDNGSKLPLP